MSECFRQYIKKEYLPDNQYVLIIQSNNIKFKTNFRNCVYHALKNRAWKQTEHDDFNLIWCEKEDIYDVYQKSHLVTNQKVNHFRFYTQLCRKDLLNKNVKKFRRALQKEGKKEQAQKYNFLPQTFSLPSEYMIFNDQFKKNFSLCRDKQNIWIMKPIAKSQGKGIFIFNKIQKINDWKFRMYSSNQNQVEPYVVQKYIKEPLLIGHKKFDIRIYVLCISYNPLVVYLNKSGFGRFAHLSYDNKDLNNLCKLLQIDVHLTNVAIQKHAQGYDQSKGGKWDLHKLKLYLISKFGTSKISQLFYNIQTIIVNSLISVQKLVANDKYSFQLYGYDIIVDRKLKPWLLEVNAGPSMHANTPDDCKLKCGIIDDVMTILDFERLQFPLIRLTGNQQQIGGFDLIYKNGEMKKMASDSIFKNLLGCKNNRKVNYKTLAINVAKRLQKEYSMRVEQMTQRNQKLQSRNISMTKRILKTDQGKMKRKEIYIRRYGDQRVRCKEY